LPYHINIHRRPCLLASFVYSPSSSSTTSNPSFF
jgi:hypothetical protein